MLVTVPLIGGTRNINLNDILSSIHEMHETSITITTQDNMLVDIVIPVHHASLGNALAQLLTVMQDGGGLVAGRPALNHTSIKVQDSALFSRYYSTTLN
jgi:hypothetical protein